MFNQLSQQAVKAEPLHPIIPVAVEIYKALTGNQYSKEDRQRLELLKDRYKQTLGVEPPDSWNLDNGYCPKKSLQKASWKEHVTQQQNQKGHTHTLHYYVGRSITLISDYLEIRANRIWPFNPKPGDITEQFFAELIDYLLNTLPSFKMTRELLNNLGNRIQYLDSVLNTQNLFNFSAVPLIAEKKSVIRYVREILREGLIHATYESHRVAARENLDILKIELESQLLKGLYWIYVGRQTDVQYESLDITAYTDTHHPEIKTIYADILQTHTGAMLQEVIVLGGVRNFGARALATPLKPDTLEYYTPSGSMRDFKYDKQRSDLPKWFEDKETEVRQTQLLGEHLIKLAKLKSLLETVYDLAGQAGNLWAYGDTMGKAMLVQWLTFFEQAQNKLFATLTPMADRRKQLRDVYNSKHYQEQSSTPNPNFHLAEQYYSQMQALQVRVLGIKQTIITDIKKFPDDAAAQVAREKQKLYRDFFEFIETNTSEAERAAMPFYQLYLQKMQTLRLSNEAKDLADKINSHPTTNRFIKIKILSLSSHILKQGDFTYFKLQAVPAIAINPQWTLGDSYAQWMAGFYHRNKNDLEDYGQKTTLLQNKLLEINRLDKIDDLIQLKLSTNALVQDLQSINKKYLALIENTKPKWRLQQQWPFIATIGRPFNQEATQFAGKLSKLLSDINSSHLLSVNTLFTEVNIKCAQHLNAKKQGAPPPKNKAQQKKILAFCERCIKAFSKDGYQLLNIERADILTLIDFTSGNKLRLLYQKIADQNLRFKMTPPDGTSAQQIKQATFLHEVFSTLQTKEIILSTREALIQHIEQYFTQKSVRALIAQSPHKDERAAVKSNPLTITQPEVTLC